MSLALSSGVTGLQAHQRMLDVAGNNLANVNSTAFKASRITFAELLSETIKKASQPTSAIGGTNPQQMGSGVAVSGISPILSQGNIVSTGNSFDVAIEGEGYFVLSNGKQNVYTRTGALAVDASSYLVDPAAGYRVQSTSSSDICIPYDVDMPASATSEIVVSGNLSADATGTVTQTQVVTSNLSYTYYNGNTATEATLIADLDQCNGALVPGTMNISGYDKDGTAFDTGLTLAIDGTTTLGDLITHLNTNVLDGSTASLVNGQVRITDDTSGYSKTDIALSYDNNSLKMPGYFKISTVGGEESKNINITVFDSQGRKHVLSGAFVRTNNPNTWDMVLTSITGDINQITMASRRIEDISFDAHDGYYTGLSGSDLSQFIITFAHDPSNPQTIQINLGTPGKLDGLTQFAGNSTAVAREQDGYEAGRLSTVSVNNEGILIGAFSNGVKKNIAVLQIALFQNPAALESIGGGYFTPSANSGDPLPTQGLSSGAGRIHGGALEKSNVDVATEFVNMIQAQNGFQANARTIRVANDILRELSNLIR